MQLFTDILMKKTTTIVLFASIFAVAVGTLGFSGNSAALMVSAVPQSQDQFGMLGHVEYKVLDEFGNIKAYMQNDNEVLNGGEDCVSERAFGVGGCNNTNVFDFIGIGNGSSGTVNAINSTLADAADDTNGACATNAAIGGDMARVQVTPQVTPASGSTGTIVVLDTAFTSTSFTFDTSNATTVIDSGVFNGDYGTPVVASRTCGGTNTSGTTWELFSRQLLTGDEVGIPVNAGDSLAVKWTITVG